MKLIWLYKINCNICDQILEGLELIDDECDVFGIHMVKIQDPQLAKRYSIKTFPALVYFRKQVPVLYDGDMHQHDKVITWLTSQDVFEIKNEIEEVNRKMLDKLLEENEFISVFFCDLLSEDEVLEWLRKNRFRQPELNIFMYALIALALAFVVYTAFLLQCFKPAPPPPVQHPKQS
ncbi:hypothetical protein ACLKA7_014531 [Drosophila subpalustris]